ncbi:hypothetical protein QYE76_013341 [Lolium multiflorum]|uniref:RNase H type-1 domain-containing protein n=1 Tax=Lolium multiflorum TaxID=4521 RepID=A0AAD8U3R6_LOLMU|nr:hypothetical protein QYE76_013341 [Lolium multiflorum]
MDRGKQIAAGLVDFVPHPPSRLDAYAYLAEPMEMTFGRFHFRVEKEGSYRVEIPISSGSSVVDSDFSSYASSTESGEEETSATRYVSTRTREKLAKIFNDMSFESSADSYISDGSSDVDSYDFIDKSITVGKVFINLNDDVTKPNVDLSTKYHQIYAIEDQEETSEAFDSLGNPYVDPSNLRQGLGNKYVGPEPRDRVQLSQAAWDRAARAMNGQHKDYLDACSEGSFTSKEVEARWDLLDRIEDNAEGWENDKGYADEPPFKPLPPKEGNEEKEEKKKKKGTKKKKKKENKKKEIGKNVQVYIDDVVITSKKGATLIEDLKETFDNLDKFCLKLNPTKCSFGVPAGELLGFLVSARGIEANPDKIQAIVTMRKPTKLKEIQQLTGRVAALSRFVARLGEKALPFYALIKQGDKFQWNEEADRAFEDLKRTISTPPILVAPKEREPLLLYIAATPQVVSTVLVVEREEEGKLHGVQRPVYFVSEVLSPSKQRYPQYQKIAYGVFTTARKLRHYFSAHPIIVVNEAPLSNILNNPEATGRVSLWGIELSPRDITYEKRKAIKSQVLPDFIAEWMELQNTGPPDLSRTWTMNFDGSKRLEGAGAGVVLISPEGDKLKYILRMTFPNASNNEAEYEALIHGMKMAKACGATRLKIFGDSQLVAQQVMNQCDAVNDSMMAYKEVYNELEKLFDGCEVNHISRLSNDEADVLANIGSQCLAVPPGVFWEEITERSTKSTKSKKKEKKPSGATKEKQEDEEEDQDLVMVIQIPWMQPYISYILRKEIPDDPVEARRVIRRSKAFTVVKGELYKRSISGVLQRIKDKKTGVEEPNPWNVAQLRRFYA